MQYQVGTSKEKHLIEFLFAFYYHSFILVKPILNIYSSRSSQILLGLTFVILLVYLINSRFLLNRRKTVCWLGLIAFVTGIFAFDFIFRRNSVMWDNYYYFLIYGAIPLFLLINVKDYGYILKYWCILAFLGGIELFTDPFHHYQWSGDYMSFGNTIMLPAFTASVIFATFYKKKKFWSASAAFLINMLISGSKGAFLSAMVVLVFGVIYISNNAKVSINKALIIILLIAIFGFEFEFIVKKLIELVQLMGIYSYSLTSFEIVISNHSNTVFSTRTDIWINALKEFKDNFAIGMGIGGFDVRYNNYPHNFILDVLVSHGIMISCIVFAYLGCAIRNTLSLRDPDKRCFFLIILFLWLCPTMVSFTFWKVISFWIFVGMNLYIKSNSIDDVGELGD